MFVQRLKWLSVVLAGVALLIVARLVQIQVVEAAEYQALATRLMTQPVRYIPATRGSILDRAGRVLVSDEPSADICVHYAALRGRSGYLTAVARELRRRGDYPATMSLADVVAHLRGELQQTWAALAEISGLSREEIVARAERLSRRVERIRAAVMRRNPNVLAIPEENQLLPLAPRVDQATAVRARLELERYPWVRVVPSTRRVLHEADAFAHLLGRLGAPSAGQLQSDPYAEDELRRLERNDQCGISGIERLAEPRLRGASGRVVEDLNRREIERIEPLRGHDVYLTIDAELQEATLRILSDAVAECVHPAGAAAVVLDVRSRDVLVLASHPGYVPANFPEEYEQLRQDTRRLPLLFRAVAGQYPPGSTSKAITLVGALGDGLITPGARFACTGHLLPDNRNAFRCWIYNQTPGATHGWEYPLGLTASDAIKHSCNIYFFRIGEKLGASRLCAWFDRFGLGRTQGTGLIEEVSGIVPTEDWLRRVAGRSHQPSDAWNYSIGQGEVTITPLQAANVAATIAAGHWAPVRLAYDATGQALGAEPQPPQPLPEEALRVLRQGMWRVVNEPGGTADRARLDSREWVLCGKTGSAQASPRVVSYRYTLGWPDGGQDVLVALSREDAVRLARARRAGVLHSTGAESRAEESPVILSQQIEERFPELLEGERSPSHAWFIGYTQPATLRRGAAPLTGEREAAGTSAPAARRGAPAAARTVSGPPSYAISVIIEYGGGGGRIAGPVARQIIEEVLQKLP